MIEHLSQQEGPGMGCAHLPNMGFAEEQSVEGPNKRDLWVQRDLYPTPGCLLYQLCDPAQ